jgi:TonB-linked SusC/RagA family outer membrane protein
MLGVSALLAQTKVITGTVTSAVAGEGVIPGVTVQAKGTTIGTVTDANGKYTLSVPQNATTLVFSFIGMKTQEVAIAGQSVINVVLESELLNLNEVVVTALGIKRESKALGYTVQTVNTDQIANSNNTNIINSLAGKVSGVRVTPSSGAAGASTFIEIRGSTSLTGNNQPLFVVDGIPIQSGGGGGSVDGVAYSDRAIDLNPDDIESISVLKGGAATALYGLRASNGVVLVTTKKGTNQTKMKVDFHTSVTLDRISHTQARQNKYAQGSSQGVVDFLEWAYGVPFNHVASPADGQFYRNASWGARIDTCSYTTDPTWVGVDNGINPLGAGLISYIPMLDYIAKWDINGRIVSANDPKANGNPVKVYDPYSFFQTGVTYNNSLSLSGGGETTTYFLSLSNQTQSGIIPNNSFGKTTVKLSGESKLTKKLTSSASMTFMNDGGDRIQQGSNISGVMLGLVRTPPTFNNAAGYIFPDGKQRTYRGGGGYDNPYWTANENIYKDNVNRLIGNLAFNFEATDWLNFSYRIGTDWYTRGTKNWFAKNSCSYPAGYLSVSRSLTQDINSDLIMSIKKNLTQSLFLTASLGNNIYQDYYNQSSGTANGLDIPNFYNLRNSSSVTPSEATSKKRTAAFFGDIGLSYKSTIFINGTGREEWSTTMPSNANKFFYPSVSASFVFTELPVLKDNKVLSFGKLRASYAIVANDATPYNTSTYYVKANPGDGWTNGVTFPFISKPGWTYSDGMGNSNLKPEQMKSFEVGGELRFFLNRISLDVAYFNNQNSDLLLYVPVAPSSGFSSKYVNAGTMKTTGVDLLVNAAIVKLANSFTWDLSVNFSNPKTMVTKLAPGVESIFLGGFVDPQIRAVAGQPYRSIYGVKKLRDPASGKLIIFDDASYDDPNVWGPGVYGYPQDALEVGNMGSVQPDWTMGITNTLSFKGFSLTGLIDIKHGGKMWNGTNGAMVYFGTSAVTLNRETPYVHEGLMGHLDATGAIVHYAADGVTELPGPGAANTIARPDDENYCYWNGQGSGFSGASEPYIESSQFVRLREITLSYTVNPNVLKNTAIRNLDVYFTGRNLWLKTPFSGIDPETSLLGADNGQGIDYFNMPGTRAVTFGLRIGF